MDFLQIKYVIAITECESMTQAAKQLHVSQSALSLSCKRLEDELGVKLFRRVGRKLALTEAGAHFCEKGKEILQQVSSLQADMAAYSRDKSPTIVYSSELGDFSTEAQKLFFSFFPNYNIMEHRDNSVETINQLLNGTVSFALTCHDHTDDDLISKLLYEEPMYAFISEDSPLAECSCIHMSQFDGEPLITQRHDYSIAAVMMNYFAATDTQPGKRYYVNDPESMFLSVRGGFGVTFIPQSIAISWSIAPVDLAPGTKMIPMHEEVCSRRIYLTQLHNNNLSESDEVFVKFLVHYSEMMKKSHTIPNPIAAEEYLRENWPEFNSAHSAGPKPNYVDMFNPR